MSQCVAFFLGGGILPGEHGAIGRFGSCGLANITIDASR